MEINTQHLQGLLREEFPERTIASYHRTTVVRDPIKRFLSAYGNRAVHHKELSAKKAGPKLAELDLDPDPSLNLFIEKLEHYQSAHESIYHHTRPMTEFTGRSSDYFSKVYRMEELDQFVAEVNTRLGTSVTLRHLQTGGPKISKDILTPTQIARLQEVYASDYEAFGSYF